MQLFCPIYSALQVSPFCLSPPFLPLEFQVAVVKMAGCQCPQIEPVICFSLIYGLVVKLYKRKYQVEQSISQKQIPSLGECSGPVSEASFIFGQLSLQLLTQSKLTESLGVLALQPLLQPNQMHRSLVALHQLFQSNFRNGYIVSYSVLSRAFLSSPVNSKELLPHEILLGFHIHLFCNST